MPIFIENAHHSFFKMQISIQNHIFIQNYQQKSDKTVHF